MIDKQSFMIGYDRGIDQCSSLNRIIEDNSILTNEQAYSVYVSTVHQITVLPYMERVEDYWLFHDEWGGKWRLDLVHNPLIIMPFLITPLEARK